MGSIEQIREDVREALVEMGKAGAREFKRDKRGIHPFTMQDIHRYRDAYAALMKPLTPHDQYMLENMDKIMRDM